MRCETPLLRRLLAKLFRDVLPAMLASMVGGLLFSQVQVGRVPEPSGARPASAEAMRLLRDEHSLMTGYLSAEVAREKAQLAATEAEPAAPRAEPAAPPAVAGPAVPPRRLAAAPPKPSLPRGRTAVVGAASVPPLVIAQVGPGDEPRPAPAVDSSLFARAAGLKDHVLAVTHRVVSAIGGIPQWIGSVGDHIGGESSNPRPAVDLVNAS